MKLPLALEIQARAMAPAFPRDTELRDAKVQITTASGMRKDALCSSVKAQRKRRHSGGSGAWGGSKTASET